MTGLPAGSYCNVIDGSSVAGACTGTTCVGKPFCCRDKQLTGSATCSFTIGSDGSLVVTVGPRQAIAVHVGQLGTGTGLPPTAQQIPVLFYEIANTTMGEVGSPSFLSSVRPSVRLLILLEIQQQNIFVVGSLPQLGNWDPSNAVCLHESYIQIGFNTYTRADTA